jgi:hypothetical protein
VEVVGVFIVNIKRGLKELLSGPLASELLYNKSDLLATLLLREREREKMIEVNQRTQTRIKTNKNRNKQNKTNKSNSQNGQNKKQNQEH